MKRKVGGRGLISIRECIDAEVRNLHEYISNSEEELLVFTSASLGLDPNEIETKKEFKERVARERKEELESMKLHGQFGNSTNDLKVKESWEWLKVGDLKRETEALIMAAQEQALNTNSIKKHIYKTSDSDKCRLCSVSVETVSHIISGCKTLAQKEYKRRHDKVCQNIHWALCKKYNIPCTDNWYQHTPEKVVENEEVKLLWDFAFQVDRVLNEGEEDENANRPDISILIKKNRACFFN